MAVSLRIKDCRTTATRDTHRGLRFPPAGPLGCSAGPALPRRPRPLPTFKSLRIPCHIIPHDYIFILPLTPAPTLHPSPAFHAHLAHHLARASFARRRYAQETHDTTPSCRNSWYVAPPSGGELAALKGANTCQPPSSPITASLLTRKAVPHPPPFNPFSLTPLPLTEPPSHPPEGGHGHLPGQGSANFEHQRLRGGR